MLTNLTENHVNWDSHIASSSISQSSFFEEVRCFTLVSLQRKLRENWKIENRLKFEASTDSHKIWYQTTFSIRAFTHKISAREIKICLSSTILRKFSKNSKSEKIWMLQSILAEFSTKVSWSILYICEYFSDDCSNFTKVRATTSFFQKIQNPVKS